MVEPELRAAAELGRWFVVAAVLQLFQGISAEEEVLLSKHSVQSPASV